MILLIFINNHKISGNNHFNYQRYPSIYDDLSYDDNESPIVTNPNSLYESDSNEVVSSNPWSRLFHRQYEQSAYTPTYYSPSKSGFALRSGEIRYVPYHKRTIPIELQKALYAHGIVGRRR
jgi:hypothetical protein